MAKMTLILDTRAKSKSKRTGLFPVVLKVRHRQVRMIWMNVFTLPVGWDSNSSQLRKSASINKGLDCESINEELDTKFYKAKQLLREIGDSIHLTTVDNLITHIKEKWDYNPNSEIKQKIENEITLLQWGKVIVERKLNSNAPGTAQWITSGMNAIQKFNGGNDLKLYDLTVTFLKNFEACHLGKGNSKTTIGIYLKAVRSIYNSAIKEDQFVPIKNSFHHYKIPPSIRTKKRAIAKEEILRLKDLVYEPFSALWNTRNYALIMFYCRGMNFADLVKIRVKDIRDNRLYYGRSKTGDTFSVKITPDLQFILNYYLNDKHIEEYLFPANYDGTTKSYEKYKTLRRRMNERLRIIADDANIDAKFTTYTIRHSWATIAKYMGISTAMISEGLGHHSIKTTEVYLKDFHNEALDEMNALVIS